MSTVTPLKHNNKKPLSSSTSSKKQASIFSFFNVKKTAKSDSTTKTKTDQKTSKNELSSPPGSATKSSKSPFFKQSSKKCASPQLTSSNDATAENTMVDISKIDMLEKEPTQLSTPLNSSQEAIDKNFAHNSDNEQAMSSSPLSRRRKINYSELSEDEDSDDENLNTKKRKNLRKVVNSDLEDDFIPEEEEEEDDELVTDAVAENNELAEDTTITAVADDDNDEDLLISDLLDADEFKDGSSKDNSLKHKYIASSDYIPDPKKSVVHVNKKKISSKEDSAAKKFKNTNEERYQWLVTIKDAEKRLESDPDYDPRTLYVPSSAWAKFTPFETQYWDIKSKMWDSIVFFKKGKFYELYEKDALLAHSLFDLKLANTGRANMQLAGIPEMSFEFWASKFIEKGYKVAKVDQKETLLGKQINERDSGKKETKVIKRDLSCVLTSGTLTNQAMIKSDMSTYCFAIKQDVGKNGKTPIFGTAFIDTSTGSIRLLEFADDEDYTNLETLVNQIRPKEIIVEKNNLSSLALKIVKFNTCDNPLWNYLKPIDEFLDSDTTLESLSQSKYFKAEDLDDHSNWPNVLHSYIESNKDVAISAFGGLLWYLKSLKLDHELISIGNIEEYSIHKCIDTLILDGQTLQNLEIFNNESLNNDGTLFKLLNRAVTPFGKRMLRNWICHPLTKVEDINARLDSVESLMNNSLLKDTIISYLSKLPDLERMLSRVHAGSLKVKEFAKVIDSFKQISRLVKEIQEQEYERELTGVLPKFLNIIPVEIHQLINEWQNAFDFAKAYNDNVLIPEEGVEPEFDASLLKQDDLEKQLLGLLREYKRLFKTQEICFKDAGKELFLIEVPNKSIKKIPSDWITMGSTTKTKRFWSPEVKVLVQELMETKERHKMIADNLKSKIYSKFDEHYILWLTTIKAVSNIDCILSLAITSENMGDPCCRPEFIETNQGEVHFEELRHPCFINSDKEFIPNDVNLGGDGSAKVGLLTGANAAGKSTVLRMTCIAVIISQLGCFVPAVSARLTPIDRIMTRLGANDNIMQGKSTFLVELSETKRMLENATPKSLLVLDELGRGGSSSDGFAIAEAVLHHLVTHVQSIGFFATHYASLGYPFRNHPLVIPLRMAILVGDSNSNSRNVTFLYKLEEGSAAGSFGMNVASMCGINDKIIENAEIAAEELEHTSRMRKQNLAAYQLSEVGIPLGLQSDLSWIIRGGLNNSKNGTGEGSKVYDDEVKRNVINTMMSMIEGL